MRVEFFTKVLQVRDQLSERTARQEPPFPVALCARATFECPRLRVPQDRTTEIWTAAQLVNGSDLSMTVYGLYPARTSDPVH